jgi:selenocysteine lyase/cysteine desulfurase
MSVVAQEDLIQARARFPVLRHTAFLNAGTFGPLAHATIDAVTAAARDELHRGRGGAPYYNALKATRTAVRARIAELIGVEAPHLALTYSTTSACQIVLSGLGLVPGDEIVTTDEEHFGLLGPLHASGARVVVASTRGRDAEEAATTLLAAVGPRTRLVAMSHVSWMTGNVLPVEIVRSEAGVPVLVDGAQSAGAISVAAAPFDFYTVSGQKWLCGPDATGGLYVRDPERLRVRLPSHWGRVDHEPDGSFTPAEGATRFDPGTIPLPSLAGLDAALAGAPGWRFEAARAIATRCRALLAEHLEVITMPDQATLVTFRSQGEPAETVERLREAGVIVRDLPGTDWIRVSCGYWTDGEDLDRLLAVLV